MSTGIPQPPSAVFVDAGGVLLLPDLDMIARHFGVEGCGQTGLHHAYFRSYEQRDPRRPESEWLWEAFANELGVNPDALPDLLAPIASGELSPWKSAVRAPHAYEFLDVLHRAGIPTVIVSNAGGDVDVMLAPAGVCQVGQGDAVPVTGIIDSHIVGVAKPDPRIFRFARQVVENATGKDLNLADAVHIGDALWSDVAAADHAGIPAIHLDPEEVCPERSAHTHVTSLLQVVEVIGIS